MDNIHKNILGIDFTINKKEDILEEIGKYLKLGTRDEGLGTRKWVKPLVIYTPNPEIVTFAQKNPVFKKIVNSAQINIPDGFGIVWAMKKIYGIEIDKITGVDFMQDLVKWASKNLVVTGLIGGRQRVALKTAECLRVKSPDIKIEVFHTPEIEIRQQITDNKQQGKTKWIIRDSNGRIIDNQKYFRNLLKEINRKAVDILFVALGFPKQEYFIDRIKNYESRIKNNKPLVLMAVGGAFDYISGRVPRAPAWMRKRGLEWLYRLIREPWRLPRQIKGVEFFCEGIIASIK